MLRAYGRYAISRRISAEIGRNRIQFDQPAAPAPLEVCEWSLYEGMFLQTGDLDLLSRSRSSYQRLVYSSKVRQELRIASVCRYLQLLLISGSDGSDIEFRDLFFWVKGDVEREPYRDSSSHSRK
ncbi:MAG: hypothetical protein D6732_13620 [Methanobacteriota archaeon]|nr:MAG: hypothetical protein D6732_13620 [Euryarchaeota archaeon]